MGGGGGIIASGVYVTDYASTGSHCSLSIGQSGERRNL